VVVGAGFLNEEGDRGLRVEGALAGAREVRVGAEDHAVGSRPQVVRSQVPYPAVGIGETLRDRRWLTDLLQPDRDARGRAPSDVSSTWVVTVLILFLPLDLSMCRS